jgi:hypothetical protein
LLPAVVRDQDPLNPPARPAEKEAKPGPARPIGVGRRHEAVIRLPAGTYVKDIDVPPYGAGRLTWTYEEDRVLGLIEASVMGFEVELATEAEYSLSSNGTIYGVITSVQLNHLRVPDGEDFADLKPYLGLVSAAEPLVSEVMVDLPFSYRFRVQGDRLLISNFRILLAGPNPLGKVGGLFLSKDDGMFAVLAGFQALGTALEGTYTSPGDQEKPAPKKRPLFIKPRSGQRQGRPLSRQMGLLLLNPLTGGVLGGILPSQSRQVVPAPATPAVLPGPLGYPAPVAPAAPLMPPAG